MGKTEAIFNVIGHRLDDGPFVPILYIGPTEDHAKAMAGDRFYKMLKTTPSLWAGLAKGQADKTAEKWVRGVRVGFAWAGSATQLASHPAGLVMLDERDRMVSDVGDEGDPVELARARTKNYSGKKIGIFSTPTVEGGSPVWALYETGTRERWAWPCPHCGAFFVPALSLLKWSEGATPTEARASARVYCPECGAGIEDRHKETCNAGGNYIPHQLNDHGEEVALPERPKNSTRSFWISGLASPWVQFGEIAEVLVKAYSAGDPAKLQAVINTWGGELFRMRGEAPEWGQVQACAREYRQGTIPAGTQRITLGADVQKYGIFYVVRAWGYNSGSWLLDRGFLAGETEYDNVWLMLGNVIRAPIGDRNIDRAFIDSGYRPGDAYRRPDHAVYSFCRRNPGIAYPTKGHAEAPIPVKANFIDYTFGGASIKNGIKLYHLDTDYFKRWLHARINWPAGQAGEWALFQGIDEDYCKQIVSEEVLQKASGRRVWIKRKGFADNHYLDCEVNAAAAAHDLGVQKLPENPPETPGPGDPGGSSVGSSESVRRRGLFG